MEIFTRLLPTRDPTPNGNNPRHDVNVRLHWLTGDTGNRRVAESGCHRQP